MVDTKMTAVYLRKSDNFLYISNLKLTWFYHGLNLGGLKENQGWLQGISLEKPEDGSCHLLRWKIKFDCRRQELRFAMLFETLTILININI